MHRILLLMTGLLGCFSPFTSLAQYGEEAQPLFESSELLECTLTTNINNVLDDRGDDADYHEAILTYTDASGEQISLEAKVKTRGKFRRDEETCQFPPLRINFPKSKVEQTLFHNQNKLKMVTHCQKDEYILKEYFIYRIYHQLTPYSFRVRLARIKYVDSDGLVPTETHYSFFIEDEDRVAERHGGEEVDDEQTVRPEQTDQELLKLMYVFQYMIGNKDFDILLRRNMKVIDVESKEAPIAVPYDFDWAEAVDASYTRVAGINTKTKVSSRVFRRLCVSREEIQPTFDQFYRIKPWVFESLSNFAYMPPEVRKEMKKYFKNFYKIIKKKRLVREEFLDNCD